MTDPTYWTASLAGISAGQTQGLVDHIARVYGHAPTMRRVAVEICRAMGAKPSEPEQVARAVQQWIQTRIQFAREAGEQVMTPGRVLLWRFGDCDDLTALAGALLTALGVPYRSRVLEEPPHIYPQARVAGRWVDLEVSDPRVRYGEDPRAFLARLQARPAFAG